MKIILFNGPPRCGKDTACQMALTTLGRRAMHYRFASPLKNAVHALFGLSGLPVEGLSDTKDKPNDTFFGMTPRQAYIWLSEEVVKPKFGKDFFAKVAVSQLRNAQDAKGVCVISDCGFQEEFDTLIKEFGDEHTLLVRLERPETTFVGDSRSYINGLTHQRTVTNNGTLDGLHTKINFMLGEFLDGQ